jgi:putative oxidoreductase
MSIALWVIQGLLALAFLMAGFTKAAQPMSRLAKSLPWTATVPAPLVRFIGVAEILGALGLILPGLTHIATFLTPVAAAGLVLVMLLASGFHARRGEFQSMGMNAVLLILALVIVVGRFTAWPLA